MFMCKDIDVDKVGRSPNSDLKKTNLIVKVKHDVFLIF